MRSRYLSACLNFLLNMFLRALFTSLEWLFVPVITHFVPLPCSPIILGTSIKNLKTDTLSSDSHSESELIPEN